MALGFRDRYDLQYYFYYGIPFVSETRRCALILITTTNIGAVQETASSLKKVRNVAQIQGSRHLPDNGANLLLNAPKPGLKASKLQGLCEEGRTGKPMSVTTTSSKRI